VVLFLAGAAAALGQELVTQYPRAYVINYNPIIESRSGQRLHLVAGWNNPNTLNPLYVGDLAQTSHDLVRYRLTTVIDADEFPLKADGFRYDDATYMACLASWSGWHMPDGVDYKMIALNFDLARRVDLGEIDEVLVQGAPYFGYWESTMAGFGGYWCNSGPQPRIACSRIFIMMGFNYERWIGEMLEDYGAPTGRGRRYRHMRGTALRFTTKWPPARPRAATSTTPPTASPTTTGETPRTSGAIATTGWTTIPT
jgi:hypothetical protein